ncbi:PRK06851 family protein [Peribacillus psychrosaccharolyticus]|uniref:PRK06851 family protein n=1 Tax=Peribacillus psychrosaccharolyticus TaxID=1407 RepID=A0A974RZ22_PERPY|nr:PRK06851 family protein [Peribacillus psychrosaccharolyticus]MEC2055308.1 PRK06851 family protein [Peribacillus psychrosaccharolyticus]MED3745298.1 PRK06851 family protein [Peribacillus psychrosaccharolyticus]QQS99003.1 PRK06851 family protein [Peribacillus psychrosaccharolyticus]
MKGKTRHYFAGGNTARGFYSLYETNLENLEKLFILKGGPGTGKSTLMKKLGLIWEERGVDVEYLHCASDAQSIDGIIFPTLKAGIVDGTPPHVIEPKAPGAVEEYVNLGTAWNSSQLSDKKGDIVQLTEDIEMAYEQAYKLFAEALSVHDEWEEIYINNLDFTKLNRLTEKLMTLFFGEMVLNKTSDVRHRFLGAATPTGAVDYVPNLTNDIPKRFFLKGRPGSGKSTMLKKLAAEATKRGFDVEIYHCGFDPFSLDMVIVRELGLAIFDSTAPHEYFPSREGDEIVDIYKTAILPATDDIYAKEIKEISERYRAKMTSATNYLSQAKELHDKLEEIYIAAMDFEQINEIQKTLEDKMNQIALQHQ